MVSNTKLSKLSGLLLSSGVVIGLGAIAMYIYGYKLSKKKYTSYSINKTNQEQLCQNQNDTKLETKLNQEQPVFHECFHLEDIGNIRLPLPLYQVNTIQTQHQHHKSLLNKKDIIEVTDQKNYLELLQPIPEEVLHQNIPLDLLSFDHQNYPTNILSQSDHASDAIHQSNTYQNYPSKEVERKQLLNIPSVAYPIYQESEKENKDVSSVICVNINTNYTNVNYIDEEVNKQLMNTVYDEDDVHPVMIIAKEEEMIKLMN
jgi:hypothetical protein